MTQLLLLLLLWRYRCDFDIEKLQHSSLAPFPAFPYCRKTQIPNPKLVRHFAKNNHRNQMADKRQKWPQNEIMFQVTQYPAPAPQPTHTHPPLHHTSTTTLGKVSQVRGVVGRGGETLNLPQFKKQGELSRRAIRFVTRLSASRVTRHET